VVANATRSYVAAIEPDGSLPWILFVSPRLLRAQDSRSALSETLQANCGTVAVQATRCFVKYGCLQGFHGGRPHLS
jgi:hypothetical protein